MDKIEAMTVAAALLEQLRALPFEQIAQRLESRQETHEVAGPSGTLYQVEAQAFRDSKAGNLRVMVSVDDGGRRAFAPVSDDFIIAPDGSFVGE